MSKPNNNPYENRSVGTPIPLSDIGNSISDFLYMITDPTGHTVSKNVSKVATSKPKVDIAKSINDTLSQFGLDNNTLIQKQTARDKNLSLITSKFSSNKGDVIGKNTIKRVKEVNTLQAEKDATFKKGAVDILSSSIFDPEYRNKLSTLTNGVITNPKVSKDGTGSIIKPSTKLEIDKLTKFASGMKTKGIKEQAALDASLPVDTSPVDTSMGFTTGDIIGTVGSVVGSVSQMVNTIQNAKATKPVVNHYAGFNEKALAANQKTKDQIGYNKDAAKAELERTLNLAENNARARTRDSATSLSTLRSLDLGVDMSTNEAKVGGKNQLDSVYGNQLLSALGVDTQLLSQKDQMEMAGATAADDANAANLDSFYTNFAQNIAGATNTIQQLGKDINESKHRNDFLKLLPQTNALSVGVDKNMNMTAPTTEANKYVTPAKTITELPAADYMNLDFMNTMNLKIPKYSFTTK